jgi:hypothetical protein
MDNQEFYVNVIISFKIRSTEPNAATNITSKLLIYINKFLALLADLGTSSKTTDVELSVREIYDPRLDDEDDD